MCRKIDVFQGARLSVAAALAVLWSSAAWAQQAGGPGQVEPRLRPVPAPPSAGAPIQVPVPSQPTAAPSEAGVRFTLSGVDFEGATALPRDRLEALAKPYIGKPVTLTDVNVALDNRGSRYLGPAQLMAGVFVNDAFHTAGRLGLSGVVTPGEGPPDLAYGAVSYDQPLGTNGLRLFGTVSDSVTRPGRASE